MEVNNKLAMQTRSAEQTPHDHFIDVTGKLCPMTFVHTRLALDRIGPGQVLAVRLRGDEAERNVPRTSIEQGHDVLAVSHDADGAATVLIRKKAAPTA